MSALVLHEYAASGNCYKVRLAAAHAGVTIERREYDITQGQTRTPAFLTGVNANGQIPVLQVGTRFLPESNAAAFYLADGTAMVPDDPFDRADVLRWLFWEQYHHEPNIATLRYWRQHPDPDLAEERSAATPAKHLAGEAALRLMDDHLGARAWLVGGALTLADLCLYAYTHVAEEGGFALARYPAVAAWLGRVAAHPRHVTLAA